MKTFKANFCEDSGAKRIMTYDEIICCLCKKSEEIKRSNPFDGVVKFFNLVINWKDSEIDAEIVSNTGDPSGSIELVHVTDVSSAEINSLQQIELFFHNEFADSTEGHVVLKVTPGIRPITGDHIEWHPDPNLKKCGVRGHSIKFYKEHVSIHPEVFDFVKLWIEEKIEQLQIILEEADRCHENVPA